MACQDVKVAESRRVISGPALQNHHPKNTTHITPQGEKQRLENRGREMQKKNTKITDCI